MSIESQSIKIPGYAIRRLLGKGAMSEVYEAESVRLGTRHAVKVYAYQEDDPEVRRRFEVEGRLLARLSHPRIVKVTDFGETADGRPYFVMDLVHDETGEPKCLGDVADGAADEETIGRWYDDVREGLAYIHGKGVVHRDLKLQNVLIGPDGHAVLTDFGISRVFAPQDGAQPIVDAVQTLVKLREGRSTVMGSLGYMAPELEMGVAASAASDYYALGVIVYKLLTGTWCDARTDVIGTLATYDPAWAVVLPKLLHANPAGREALSWSEVRREQRDRAEADWETRWLQEKARGHLARHVARYAGAASIVLALLAGFGHVQGHNARLKLENRLLQYENAPRAISFDQLFSVPSGARADEQTDDDGNTVMPSRNQFAAARLDALVLTQRTLSSLQEGSVTIEKVVSDFERLRDMLDEDSDRSPFDGLEFGDTTYFQQGENRPLQMLFEQAIERLKALAED